MKGIVYTKKGNDAKEVLSKIRRSDALFVDKDGVIADISELLYINRRLGFEANNMKFEYSKETNYMLGGIGDRHFGILQSTLAFIAFDRLFDSKLRNRPGAHSKDREFQDIIRSSNPEDVIGDLIRGHTSAADIELAERIRLWDNGAFFSSDESGIYVKPHRGAKEALFGLIDMYKGKAGIVTNTYSSKAAERDLRACGFSETELKSVIIVYGAKKPLPDGILKAAGIVGARAEQSVYVGDSVIDLRAARNAGSLPVGVTGGMGTLGLLKSERPDIILDGLESLHMALRK